MAKRENFSISDFYCTACGSRGLSLPRKGSKCKEPGHLKRIYCIHCGKEWNHAEIRPICNDYSYKDFQLEMQYHNFDENGNRKEPYRIFRGNLKKEGIING